MTVHSRHENYEILNLIGYGLAKFDVLYVKEFGVETKSAFYESIVKMGVAETSGTIKNRQDIFDPFFNNGRKGWWQKGNTYIHRKKLIDSLFGDLGVTQYAQMTRAYLNEYFPIDLGVANVQPIIKSRFRKLQETGLEAEVFFREHFEEISQFSGGFIQDARLLGDGYDFQIEVGSQIYLSEVKGVRGSSGPIRLTEREFQTANEYKSNYAVIVVANLDEVPKAVPIFDPIRAIALKQESVELRQTQYRSPAIDWMRSYP